MNTSSTLADLATTHPAASRVFKRHGLDFCCGGRKPLADVCSTKGLDADGVLQEIAEEERIVDLPRWDTAPLPALIDFILERYHARLREELPALIALAARVEMRHGEKASCPRGLKAHLEAMYYAVLSHLEKEEQVLFPMIRRGAGAFASGPIFVMEEEHADHGVNLAHIRDLTINLVPPADACPTWRALYLRLEDLESDLFDHIHLENNVLFPRALRESERQS
jgi:regulator of cell morphogenesis and NO signaling